LIRVTAAHPFASPCACSRLRRAARAVTQLYDDALAPIGLRVTQLSLLRTLQRRGTLRIGELADQNLLDRTALSRNLDPLAERKLVAIVPGRDARTREVTLTKQGIAAIAAAAPHWEKVQREVAKHVGRDRLDGLYEILRDIESLHPGPAGSGS
jgi:DNA-binding MarR family transcriptional regulator